MSKPTLMSTETVYRKDQTDSDVVERNSVQKKNKQTLVLSTETLYRKEQTDSDVDRNSVQKRANGL